MEAIAQIGGGVIQASSLTKKARDNRSGHGQQRRGEAGKSRQ